MFRRVFHIFTLRGRRRTRALLGLRPRAQYKQHVAHLGGLRPCAGMFPTPTVMIPVGRLDRKPKQI